MKKYIKPTIEVLELRVNENLAYTQDTRYGNPANNGNFTPITKYSMNLDTGSVQ